MDALLAEGSCMQAPVVSGPRPAGSQLSFMSPTPSVVPHLEVPRVHKPHFRSLPSSPSLSYLNFLFSERSTSVDPEISFSSREQFATYACIPFHSHQVHVSGVNVDRAKVLCLAFVDQSSDLALSFHGKRPSETWFSIASNKPIISTPSST